MGPSMGYPRLSSLSLLLLSASATVHASSGFLFPRQDAVCGGNSELAQCGTDFPSEFCCPKDTACQRLNSGSESVTSVICCPNGQDCAFIQPVTCDITQFDAVLHPDNQLHLSNSTEVSLAKCGSSCCPVGYACNGNSMCQADPASGSPTPSPSAVPTSSSPPYLISTPSPTNNSPSASQTTEGSPVQETQKQSSGFDGKSFVAGFIPGIVLGALIALGLVYFLKKRRARDNASPKSRFSGDFGHISRNISDPIYDPTYAARTDFIRQNSTKTQKDASHNSPPFGQPLHRPHSDIDSSAVMQSSMRAAQGISTGPGNGLTPKIKSLWERTPKLGFGSSTPSGFVGLPSHPAPSHSNIGQQQQMGYAHGGPPPPLIRAGSHTGRDPYKTPSMHRTPARTMSYTRSHRTSLSSSSVPLKNQQFTPQRPANPTPGGMTTILASGGVAPFASHVPTGISEYSYAPSIQASTPAQAQRSDVQRPEAPARSGSQETIDIGLMRPPSFLAPPKAGFAMRENENRLTQDTTFTKLMERAGYEGEEREEVRQGSSHGWGSKSPARAR